MARRFTVVIVAFLLLAFAAIVLPLIAKARLKANIAASQNNLREIALFAAHYSDPNPNRNAKKLLVEIPAGTITLDGFAPEDRLSWVVPVLPGMDQRRQNTEAILQSLERDKPWSTPANTQTGRMPLATLLCPGNTPQVASGEPAITCYVGIAGLGANAATLTRDSPNAGAFRYDSSTPFDRVTDGLSQTLLFAETRHEVGAWLRGGASTLRGLDHSANALPLIGDGAQFGGYFPQTANFAMCDGGVRVFTSRVEPRFFYCLATIAGKETDPIPID